MRKGEVVAAVAYAIERMLLEGPIMQPRAFIRAVSAAVPGATMRDLMAAILIVQARSALLAEEERPATIH